MQTVEKLVKQRNVFEFLCKDFRMVRLRMEFDPKRTAEENEAVWKQAYYAFVAYVEYQSCILYTVASSNISTSMT